MRIVLAVTTANPELLAELEKIPPRLRAERVRMLATLGLAAMSSSLPARKAPVADADDAPAKASQEKPTSSRALSFAKSLGEGV